MRLLERSWQQRCLLDLPELPLKSKILLGPEFFHQREGLNKAGNPMLQRQAVGLIQSCDTSQSHADDQSSLAQLIQARQALRPLGRSSPLYKKKNTSQPHPPADDQPSLAQLIRAGEALRQLDRIAQVNQENGAAETYPPGESGSVTQHTYALQGACRGPQPCLFLHPEAVKTQRLGPLDIAPDLFQIDRQMSVDLRRADAKQKLVVVSHRFSLPACPFQVKSSLRSKSQIADLRFQI